MGNKVCKLIVPFLGIMGASLPAATLVENGMPAATIVIDANATRGAQFAALELQWHVKKMTGAELPIIEGTAPAAGTKILVGANEISRQMGVKSSDFKKQEYLVTVKNDIVILSGKDKEDTGKVDYQDVKTFPDRWEECGTCHAVYDFLERLGFRWYLPTDLGVTYTPSQTLKAADVGVKRAPFMKYRDPFSGTKFPVDFAGDSVKTAPVASISPRDTELWHLRKRAGGERIIICHSFYTYYKRFWPTRPELFAQGYDEQPPQLCYNNPATLRQVVQDARDFFDGNRDSAELCSNMPSGFKSNVFPVFPMDNSSWCKCPQCQSQLKPKAESGPGQFSNDRASEYIFGFVNKVAREIQKTHPDKFIGAGTYAEFCYPPKHLEPNVMVMICLHSRIVYAPHVMENDQAVLGAWNAAHPKTPKIIWMYYCFPTYEARNQQYRAFPGFFANHVRKHMKDFVDAGVYGIFTEPSYMVNGQQSFLMDQVEGDITFKLADDPSLDGKILFDEFFERYYGLAAEPMRRFYLTVEKAYCDPANYPPKTKHHTEAIAWGNLGTEERMNELEALMNEAMKLAVSAPFKQRVEVFEKGIWQYMQKGRRAYLERAFLMAPTMQQAQACRIVNPEPGDPLTAPWDKASRLNIQYGGLQADKLERKIKVKMAHDGEYLYLMYEEDDVDTDKLTSSSTVWGSDEWESYFAKQRGEPYHVIGINPNAKYEALNFSGTVRDAWEFKGKIVPVKTDKNWKTYIAIPLDNLVAGGIKPGEMLYYNMIRSSRLKAVACWVPTFAGYHAPGRFGEIYLEK